MKPLWWEQVKAVARLEMKKTFFARRGLWIYFLAAAPVLLFAVSAAVHAHQQSRNADLAQQNERRLSYQDLLSIRAGMTKEEVLTSLGRPPIDLHWTETRPDRPVSHEHFQYSDGQNQLYVTFTDGKVESTHVQSANDLGENTVVFASIFQFFFLRLAVFFGCLGIFMNLFRGEVLDRSLHFYFLSPVRREVLMAGKFLAGLLATCTIFVTSEVLQTVAFLGQFPPNVRDLYLYHHHGLEHAAVYVGVTILGCIGYGAFFLVAGMFFRNPILPAAGILIWEGINPFLPAVLKQISVIYYLKSLCPVDIPAAPGTPPVLALLIWNADPISAPVAVIGLLLVSVLALYVSSIQVRRMEINYTSE
jgi:outer membrane protein assembly factor BamE (lipoprotein component of BamABCDE complex)